MQADDELSGLPNAGNGAQGTEATKNATIMTDDKSALNEHERMTQIHTKCTYEARKKRTQRRNEIALTSVTDSFT